jgi:hypothetical protein
MNKKKIDVDKVASELREGSVFFRPPTEGPTEGPVDRETARRPDGTTPRRHDATTSRQRGARTSGHQDSAPARRRDATPDKPGDRVTTLGSAVQELGTRRTTIRFSRPEKTALKEIIHTYDRRDIRTTENELTRIAVNWLVEDYREQGERSVLAQVVAQLQARQREE